MSRNRPLATLLNEVTTENNCSPNIRLTTYFVPKTEYLDPNNNAASNQETPDINVIHRKLLVAASLKQLCSSRNLYQVFDLRLLYAISLASKIISGQYITACTLL